MVLQISLVPEHSSANAGTVRSTPDELIEQHVPIARSMASRYRNRGIDLDDLEQVALLGLTKAARRFDPDAGFDFMSYAVPTVRGELRKHFRDCGWTIRPPRRVQDLQARISRAQSELEAVLHRAASAAELAAHLDEGRSDVVEALTADGCFTPTSLDGSAGDGTSTLGELLGNVDPAMDRAEARVMLAPLVDGLAGRDRRIVQLRFVEERTQQEIAEDIGLTQAQVSRVLTRILGELRTRLGALAPVAA